MPTASRGTLNRMRDAVRLGPTAPVTWARRDSPLWLGGQEPADILQCDWWYRIPAFRPAGFPRPEQMPRIHLPSSRQPAPSRRTDSPTRYMPAGLRSPIPLHLLLLKLGVVLTRLIAASAAVTGRAEVSGWSLVRAAADPPDRAGCGGWVAYRTGWLAPQAYPAKRWRLLRVLTRKTLHSLPVVDLGISQPERRSIQ